VPSHSTRLVVRFLIGAFTLLGVMGGATALVSSSTARATTAQFVIAAEDAGAAARGLSRHGGVLSSEANEAGGTVWTSTGRISQNDVAPIVNSGLYSGDVNILTGVHGLPDGSTLVDASLYADDVARFGNLPGVTVHNLPDLAPEEITSLLRGPGTTIGGMLWGEGCCRRFSGKLA